MISPSLSLPASAAPISRAVAEMDDFPKLAGWQLVRRLGGGGMTEVFQARPITGTAPLAAGYVVKTLAKGRHDDGAALDLLCREARAGSQIKHPHVVPVLATNLHQRPYFIVMPFLPGATLTDILAAGGRPVLPVALWLIRQAAEALDAMQQAGWTHGDVKADNLIVAASGHVTLIDLGFARHVDETSADGIVNQSLAGTLDYLAPELLTSALRIDIRSDLYSLGITLYQLLTGRVPFSASDPRELARQQREEKPQDLRILIPNLPTRVARLVRSLLAKDPNRRPATASEVVHRLTSLEIESFDDRSGISPLRDHSAKRSFVA